MAEVKLENHVPTENNGALEPTNGDEETSEPSPTLQIDEDEEKERERYRGWARMELDSRFDISLTVDFILTGKFTKVALQFPDELLKESVRVVRALRGEILRRREYGDTAGEVSLFVMADTAYGSCCVDEVGASHVAADCVVHYGHTCLSPTSKLPAFFVFGKSPMSVSECVKNLMECASSSGKPILVLFGLEYAHLIQNIREEVVKVCESESQLEISFSEILCSCMNPSGNQNVPDQGVVLPGVSSDDNSAGANAENRYTIGGLVWKLGEGQKMEDHLLFWIGSDNSAFANVVLTYNGCEIVRYDPIENRMAVDFSQQKRILKRRYYLVEKAKDANIVGILVGTLGVAGYLQMINQMKELIGAAGKKAYTLVVGRPNPAKLANFPECDVFIYVSCAQTALLDSKEYLAPVITPYEATLAFKRGSQWTGAYVMEFRDLMDSSLMKSSSHTPEARFSFIHGGYVEDLEAQEKFNEDDEEGVLALANTTEKALQLRENANILAKRRVKSGAEFLATRSYQGLEINYENSLPESYLIGRSGRAAGYEDERSSRDN